MKNQKQTDPKWANRKINGTDYTMRTDGCLIIALANMLELDPLELIDKLEKNNCFNGALLILEKVAQALGMDYQKTSDARLISPAPMKLPCIVEVDFSPAEGKQQHFSVYLGNNKIIDSWDGLEKVNPYEIINYRNIFLPLPNQKDLQIEKLKQENEALKVSTTSTNQVVKIEDPKIQPTQSAEYQKTISTTNQAPFVPGLDAPAPNLVLGKLLEIKNEELSVKNDKIEELVDKLNSNPVFARFKALGIWCIYMGGLALADAIVRDGADLTPKAAASVFLTAVTFEAGKYIRKAIAPQVTNS